MDVGLEENAVEYRVFRFVDVDVGELVTLREVEVLIEVRGTRVVR